MLTLIKDIISGLAAFFRAKEKTQDRLNTPEMQANERAKTNAAIRNAATKAVAKDDLEEIRRQASE